MKIIYMIVVCLSISLISIENTAAHSIETSKTKTINMDVYLTDKTDITDLIEKYTKRLKTKQTLTCILKRYGKEFCLSKHNTANIPVPYKRLQ